MESILITIGDPAGIGPEVTLKALAAIDARLRARVRLIGSLSVLARTQALVGTRFSFSQTRRPGDPDSLALTDLPVAALEPTYGKVQPVCGEAAYRYVCEGARACLQAQGRKALVTAPLNKFAVHSAGYAFVGHTELLQELSGVEQVWMLLAAGQKRVLHLTTHLPLAEAIKAITIARLLEGIRAGAAYLSACKVPRRRIALAGVNPHAGENGRFGDEERRLFAPAVRLAREEGFDVKGPLPPDSVYREAFAGDYDLVIAPYHDQGHIALKLVAFDEALNITLGLPFFRVSVDHGTAFAIAGKNLAREDNMVAAITCADQALWNQNSAGG